MSGSEYIKIQQIPPSPIRDYARDAVAAVRHDARQGVLAWRIATYLATQFLSDPRVSLYSLPAGSVDFYLGLAQTVQALCVSIDGDAPPTPGEIAHIERRKALAHERSRVKCHATANRHELGLWRVDFDRPGREEVSCVRCGAGANLPLDLAVASISDGLFAECSGVRR